MAHPLPTTDPFVILAGGLVANSPHLPVLDVDALHLDLENEDAEGPIEHARVLVTNSAYSGLTDDGAPMVEQVSRLLDYPAEDSTGILEDIVVVVSEYGTGAQVQELSRLLTANGFTATGCRNA